MRLPSRRKRGTFELIIDFSFSVTKKVGNELTVDWKKKRFLITILTLKQKLRVDWWDLIGKEKTILDCDFDSDKKSDNWLRFDWGTKVDYCLWLWLCKKLDLTSYLTDSPPVNWPNLQTPGYKVLFFQHKIMSRDVGGCLLMF